MLDLLSINQTKNGYVSTGSLKTGSLKLLCFDRLDPFWLCFDQLDQAFFGSRLYFTLGPCVFLVAVLYLISKYVDLANFTLKNTYILNDFAICICITLMRAKKKSIRQQIHCLSFARPVLRLRDPCCDFARRMLRLCATQIGYVATLYESCCDFVRLMIRPCSAHDSTLIYSINPVRLIIQPGSTHDSTLLFDS